MEFNPDESAFLRMLAGNLVTASAIWMLLDLNDTNALRAAHPLVHDALNQVPMHWVEPTTVNTSLGMRRLKSCYPSAAFAMKVGPGLGLGLDHEPMLRELPLNVTNLELIGHRVTDETISYLPSRLCRLIVSGCSGLTKKVSFSHLTNLTELNCGFTKVSDESIASLPQNIRRLNVATCDVNLCGVHFAFLEELDCALTDVNNYVISALPCSIRKLNVFGCVNLRNVSFAHLTAMVELNCSEMSKGCDLISMPCSLRILDASDVSFSEPVSFSHLNELIELRCSQTNVNDSAVAGLPNSIVKLRVSICPYLTEHVSFAHLTRLEELYCDATEINDAVVSTFPSSILKLRLVLCENLTEAVSFTHLTNLLELDCWGTSVGNAAVATLQPSMQILHLGNSNVTDAVSFSHLPTLKILECTCEYEEEQHR